jgi:hypothetical protein
VTATSTPCAGGQLCAGAAPNGACGCSNTCSAAQVGTYCVDAKTVATCTPSNGCFASSGAMTCPGHPVLQRRGGSAACSAPRAAPPQGTSCNTAGGTTCDGTSVLTCTTEAGSGCHLWVKTTDCAGLAGGPSSADPGRTAACQCPDPGATTSIVDPVAGHDTATVAPNGANTPAACRYKTITKALTAVTSTRRRVVATTANPAGTFTTRPSRWCSRPTSPSTPPTHADAGQLHHRLRQRQRPPAITMGDGAILEGFTVQRGRGNAAASAISCSRGAVTVRRCVLAGPPAAAPRPSRPPGIAISTATPTPAPAR